VTGCHFWLTDSLLLLPLLLLLLLQQSKQHGPSSCRL
jgi:hypothetical protein